MKQEFRLNQNNNREFQLKDDKIEQKERKIRKIKLTLVCLLR